jgi:hypothetical protein
VKRCVRPLVALMLLWKAMPLGGPSWAATATSTVTGGTLSLSANAAASISVPKTGHDQSLSYSVPLFVTDATGTGLGWNLQVTSTEFSSGGPSPRLLPPDASTIEGATWGCTRGTCTGPANSVRYPVGLPAGAPPPPPVKLFDAGLATGAGQLDDHPHRQGRCSRRRLR